MSDPSPSTLKLFDLAGRVALVTGGSRGLGRAIAAGLAGAGARVAVAARGAVDANDGPAFAHEFFGVDLIDERARAGLVAKVAQKLGPVDILVHAAGQQHREPAENFPLARFREVLELHVNAGFDLAQQVVGGAGGMLARRHGKIIFISSVLGFEGGLMVPAYAAGKHAVLGMVKALANEWAPRGVNVNAIAPGYFATAMAVPVLTDPVRGPAIMARIPAGRAGKPEELVGAAVFLASEASNYVHGQSLVVDGGWLSR
ncbi:MAG: SDR family oxidoreductase [Planctomycetota bacterium]|nr:SDR family oxidoreductase [Planctomycetota bacterium]